MAVILLKKIDEKFSQRGQNDPLVNLVLNRNFNGREEERKLVKFSWHSNMRTPVGQDLSGLDDWFLDPSPSPMVSQSPLRGDHRAVGILENKKSEIGAPELDD
ncbi:hypothetical protein NPIL_242381 [Nephila pilipes]|uniref:Uncharacterized protein n=1 Tax=Nephila pilipes TaxID=299642 RepID=A0A8X6PSW4_NEPPI|nr:hypothetical protein NPIL_242381 [Nephila pilipes]